jgi:hypothetical protein
MHLKMKWFGLAMGGWEWVAMDSLKFHPGPPCLTFLRLFEHSTPYAYAFGSTIDSHKPGRHLLVISKSLFVVNESEFGRL